MLRALVIGFVLTGLFYVLIVAPMTAALQRTGYNPAAALQVLP